MIKGSASLITILGYVVVLESQGAALRNWLKQYGVFSIGK
jgi:hypothetical protein